MREDTITAIATATGAGAVGIVRVSGRDAEGVLRRSFSGLPQRLESHRLYLGRVVHVERQEVLDEGLAVLMRGPRSFTGEDVVELQVHGGVLNMRRVLEATLAAGARQAEPGEFSLRAFLNGRLDLTQAEAIADLIEAESEEALRVAQAQLGGALREPITLLRQRVLDLLTLLEASLDFAGEEHVYQLDREACVERMESVRGQLERLLRAYASGRLSLGGARVVLVGAPNAGKSSLFNRLVGAERAIVTEIPGTTRDTVEESTRIAGQRVHLVDTAGLRVSEDEVERLGVERSLEQAAGADLVCWVHDAREALGAAPAQVMRAAERGGVLIVLNHVDRLGGDPGGGRAQRMVRIEAVRAGLEPMGLGAVRVVTTSALTGEGLARLEEALSEQVAVLQGRSEEDVPLITSLRHAEALREAELALARATEGLEAEMPLELCADDVRVASDALGQVIGAIATDDVLGAIFSQFCVGK